MEYFGTLLLTEAQAHRSEKFTSSLGRSDMVENIVWWRFTGSGEVSKTEMERGDMRDNEASRQWCCRSLISRLSHQ